MMAAFFATALPELFFAQVLRLDLSGPPEKCGFVIQMQRLVYTIWELIYKTAICDIIMKNARVLSRMKLNAMA